MALIDFSKFTLNEKHEITDLSKVLFTTAFTESNLFDTCTRQTGVKSGDLLDYVDNLGEVGVAGRKCDPTYSSVDVKGFEKVWLLGDWNVAKRICYKDLENTIAKWCLNEGTANDDLTSTDFWNKIMLPLLDRALTSFYWRLAWFGDSEAKEADYTSGTDLTLINATDGLWKRIFAVAAANSGQHTEIAANNTTTNNTTAKQKTAIRATGAALEVLDNLLADADSRIAANGGKLMLTRSLYQAFRRDYSQAYKDTIPFMEVADGVKVPTYDGVPVMEVPEWDTLITKYENNGTVLNLPHRAVFTNPDNLFVGTGATDTFAEFDTIFDRIKRYNHIYAASNLGTLIGEDDLIQVAY